MKRDCVFLVADGTMAQVFASFLRRGHIEERLGCRAFDFDEYHDLAVAIEYGQTNGGLHVRAHEFLRRYRHSHRHAVVALDQKFGGERPAAEIREEILDNLCRSGWSRDVVDVVVIDPELEVWLWQRGNPHVSEAFRYRDAQSLEDRLEQEGFWPPQAAKPTEPKAAAKWLIDQIRPGPPMVVYRRIARTISVRGCRDPAFRQLTTTLRRWFPLQETEEQPAG